MNEESKNFQSLRFWIWTLAVLNVLLIVLPANATTTKEIRKTIVEETLKTRVLTSLAMAVVKTEVNFQPGHERTDGGRGHMQKLPDTAKSLGFDPRSL